MWGKENWLHSSLISLSLFPLQDRVISTEKGESKAKELNVLFVETSAKSGHNIKQVCHSLAYSFICWLAIQKGSSCTTVNGERRRWRRKAARRQYPKYIEKEGEGKDRSEIRSEGGMKGQSTKLLLLFLNIMSKLYRSLQLRKRKSRRLFAGVKCLPLPLFPESRALS